MFDPLISENTARTRRPLAVALSFVGQVLVVTLAVVAPLLHTETITPGHLLGIISVPRRIGVMGVITQRLAAGDRESLGPRAFSEHALRQPVRIPTDILPEMKLTSADLIAGLPGSVALGDPNGLPGVAGMDLAQIPGPVSPKLAPQIPAPAVRAPLRVGGKVQAAKIVRQVKPVYPPLARQARISGIVRLEAVISRRGGIESLQVMSGHPLLTQAALDAVRQWVYQPTLLNGEPAEVLTQIEVNFKLAE